MSKAVVISHPLLPERDADKELSEKIARIEAAHTATINASMFFSLSDEELDRLGLPDHVKYIAKSTRLPKSEIPFGIIAAHEFVIAREKSRATLGAGNKVNINVSGGGVVGVVAPSQQVELEEGEVVELLPPKEKK